MKADRKTKAEKSPPNRKATKRTPRTAPKTRADYPLAAYEQIPVGIVETSLEGQYIEANEEFCRIMGYTRAELLQLGIKDCTHEDDYAIDSRLHEQLVAGKIPYYKLEKRYIRKDGEAIWVELTRTLVCDEKGRPLYSVGVILDISERKDVERVLRESVERLRLATESARMFMWEWDLQQHIYTVDDNFEKVIGFSGGLLPKDSIESVQRLMPSEDRQAVNDALVKAIEDHSDLHSLQVRFVNPDNGEMVWLEINGKIVYDDQGNAERMFGVTQNITERKRAQDEIAIISRMPGENPNPVMRITPDGKILYANPAGLPLVESWTRQTDQAIPPELQRSVEEAFTSRLKTEVEIEDNGKTFSCTLAPIHEAGYVNLYGKDTTARKQAEQALRSSEERMRLAIEANRMVAWEWDPAIDQVITSENVADIYGLDAVDNVATGFSLIWPEDLPAHQEKVERVTRQGGEYRSEFRVTRPVDGRVLWMEERAIALSDAAGQVARLVGVVTDITERRQAEEKLRESEERFRALVSQATAGIAETDTDGRLRFVNPRFCEMLGYTKEELLGQTIWDLTYAEDLGENRRLFQRMIEQGESYQFEKRFVRKDGSKFWTNVTVSSIRDLDGKPKGGVGVIIDIEQRKQAEQALKEFARQQEALYKLSDQLHRADSLQDVFDAALDAILSAVQSDRASILLFDETDVMRFVAWRGLSEEYRRTTDGHSPWTPDVKDPESICIDDVRTADLSESLRATIEREGIASLAFIPLVSNEKLIGKFMIYFDALHAFDDEEIDLSLTIAHQLAFGIDRKHADEQIRRLNSELQARLDEMNSLLEILPTGVWIGNQDGSEITGNSAAYQMLGLPAGINVSPSSSEPRASRGIRVFVDGQEVNPENTPMHVVARSGQPMHNFEHEIRFKDGTNKIMYGSIVPLFDQDGAVRKVIGTYTDMTERKQAENRLALLADISEMLRNFDDPHELMYSISQALGEHLHVKRVLFNEIDLEHHIETVQRDYHQDLESVAGIHNVSDYSSVTSAELASGRTVVNSDSKIDPRTAADHERTYALSRERSYVAVPMMRDNRWVASLWVGDDAPREWTRDEISLIETIAERTWTVIEKLRINAELRQSEERFRQAANASGALVYEVDLVSGATAVVHGMERLIGFAPQGIDISSDWWHSLIHPDDLPGHLAQLEQLVSRGGTDVCEYRVRHKSGEWLIVQDNRLVVQNESGDSVRLVGAMIDITERKRAEEALRASEERYRAVVESQAEMLCRFRPDGTILFVNEAYARARGTTAEKLMQDNFWAFIPEEDRPGVRAMLERLTPKEPDVRIENRFQTVDGERWTLWTNRALRFDESGRLLEVQSSGIDITDRKRAEESLQLSEHKFSSIFHAAPFAISLQTFADSRFADVNNAFVQLLGYEREDLIGRTSLEVGIETDETMRSRALQEFEGQGFTRNAELQVKTKSGRAIWVSASAEVVTIAGEDHILTLAVDITARKQAEEALRESEERYRGIVNQTIAGIAETDLTGTFIMVNDRYCEIGGYRREELLRDMRMQDVTHPDDLQQNLELFGRLAADGTSFEIEKRYIRPDGSIVWVHNSVSAIVGADGKPRSAVAAVMDVTERKRAEETMRRNEELFSTLVETAPFGVYFIDSEFRLRAINKGSEAVFRGIEPLIGRDFAEILRIVWEEPFATEAIERFRHTLRTGEPFISPPIIEPRANIDEIQSYDWQIHRITMPDGTFGVVCYFYDLSEQKRMEATVRASESLYRAIARNIPGGGVYVVDKDFRYLVAEGPVTEAFGLTREMLEGHTVMEVFPDERGTRMEERLRRTFAGETVSFETKSHGRVYWSRQAPLHESIGQAIILTLDITERKQAEEALRQSEERFARFMQRLPGLAWIKDLEGRYVYANAATEHAFGTPIEQLYGKTDEEIFPPEVAAQFRKNDQQALRDEKGIQVVETLEQDDGILHYSLVSKFPIPGPDGKTALIGGTAFDITERRQAEEALRESEERFSAILRQATAGIVRKDAEGRLIYVNQAFCNMLGYTEAELLGKTMWDFMHEDDIAENKQWYSRLMMEGIPFKLERRLLREDGSVIWVDASVSPIMDATGKPQSAVAVEVDITRRKQAEEELQQLNLQLEERVLNRTAKLRAVNQTLREEIAERQRVEEALRQSEAVARANEQKLSTLFELLPVGISFLDLEGKIIQMNSALANILKLSKDQLADQAYQTRKYIRADGSWMSPAEFASRRALTEGRTVYNVETGILLEDSEVVWTSVSAAPVAVADVGAVVVTVDITESKRAERALQESRERLQILSQRLVEVQEEERRAIARELHDRVGQTLAALNINLIIISGQLTGKVDEQVSARLSDSMKLVSETITLVRDVMSNLRPSVLDDYGLEAALQSHINEYMSRYEIRVVMDKPGQSIPRMAPSIEMTFLRIAQEALMNIARHAQATQVNLSLSQEENVIRMTVEDNGVGIESWQRANRPGSHGLTIMRERAEAFGGTLVVSSVPRQGTRVEVRIPFEDRNPPSGEKEVD